MVAQTYGRWNHVGETTSGKKTLKLKKYEIETTRLREEDPADQCDFHTNAN